MESVYWVLAPIARGLVRLGVSANAVTGTSLVLGAFAGLEVARGQLGAAAVLSTVSALCDAVDGFVARESRTQSQAGEIFDATVDRYNEFFFLAGLAFLFRDTGWVLGLVLATIHGSFMVSYSSARADALRIVAPRGFMRRPERATYLTAGTALSALAVGIGGSLGTPVEAASIPILGALLLVGVGSNISAAHRLLRTAQLAARREQLGAPGVRPPPSASTAPPTARWAERFARR
jgi:phosphatidylglycerophosphate synthase